MARAPGATLTSAWARLSPLPGGTWLFSRLLAFVNPYSGAVGARVVSLGPGHAVLRLKDRRGVRNHLDSIHAIALANVAEMASGLAMLAALPAGARGIVTAIRIEYLKKARGTLVAESRIVLPDVTADGTHDFTSEVRDQAGVVVARATVTWKLGPDKQIVDGRR
ncbi:MAG: hotdog fold domain-containing protein [Gemmatimonadales bacterium]